MYTCLKKLLMNTIVSILSQKHILQQQQNFAKKLGSAYGDGKTQKTNHLFYDAHPQDPTKIHLFIKNLRSFTPRLDHFCHLSTIINVLL